MTTQRAPSARTRRRRATRRPSSRSSAPTPRRSAQTSPDDCPKFERGLTSLYLGFDLGGTNIRTAVARIEGDAVALVGRDARATPQTGPEAVVNALVASANAAIGGAKTTLAQ